MTVPVDPYSSASRYGQGLGGRGLGSSKPGIISPGMVGAGKLQVDPVTHIDFSMLNSTGKSVLRRSILGEQIGMSLFPTFLPSGGISSTGEPLTMYIDEFKQASGKK
jgi:hypothetical protein